MNTVKVAPDITLGDVPVSHLRGRIEAYKLLFLTILYQHRVMVKGIFTEKSGDILFSQSTWKVVDMQRSGRVWLCVNIDGNWSMVRPDKDIIEEVMISAI